jgi:NHLM bacteriocin system ABC transporter ATP-binding protein
MAVSTLEDLLRGEAREIEAGGNAPLALAAGECWLLAAGRAEVFAVARERGSPWIHLGTVEPGGMLFGAAPGGSPEGTEGMELVAAGGLGTRLLQIPVDRLTALAAAAGREADLAALASGVDGWLGCLVHAVPRPAAPKAYHELLAGAETVLEKEGLAARTRAGLLWVRPRSGVFYLLGRPDLALHPGMRLPLPEEAWLVAREAGALEAAGTPAVLAEGRLREDLDRFHAVLLGGIRAQAEEAAREERERLELRIERDRQTMRNAYARLASVLAELPAGEIEAGREADLPLLAACRLVGGHLGVPIRTRTEAAEGRRQGDLLTAICAASRIRSRRVILREGWWRHDNGPLVAFRVLDEEGKQRRPVALLPVSARRYEMVDPADGTRTPVDAAAADALSGEAYMFYPPLPARPLKAWDLFGAALRNRREDLVTIVLMGVGGGLLGLLVPILTGRIFGTAIPGADRGQLAQMALALIVGALAATVFQITRSIAVLRLGGKMDGALQAAVWDRLLSLPVTFFRGFTVGDLANRSLGIDAIREQLTGNVLTSILAAIFSLFSFGLLFYYSRSLALVATGMVLVLMAVTTLLVWLQVRHQRELFRLEGKISSLLFGLLGGIAKLRVGGAERRAYALWAHRFAEQRQRAIRAQRAAIAQAAFNAVYGVFASLALFAMVGLSSQDSSLPVGDFLAFNAAFGQFLAAALSMIGVFSSLLAVVPLYERLEPILKTVPEVDPSQADADELTGEIEFSHVSFRYQGDGPAILEDVSFRAGPGEFIALVGPSGAGKSTCLRLILGFERPVSGSIYFDGQDLASLSLQSVRRQLGVVLQSGRPMVGNLYSCIVGSSSLGIDDAWEAARMAGLEEDIKAMPMGMHTVISEGAETFSGGQKQRLLIARAIVHRPRIILFDEATSALDNRTQEIVSRSLEQLKATRIVIAHRLSTIVNADRIYVMQGGRVVEAGTYQDLIRQGGLFAQLVARQVA